MNDDKRNKERPDYGLSYVQVLNPAPPGIFRVLGDSLSRREVVGQAIGLPVMLSMLGAPAAGAPATNPGKAHGEAVLSLAVSPDGKSLASGAAFDDRDRSLKIWEIGGPYRNPIRDEQLRASVLSLAFSPDRRLAVAPTMAAAEIRLPPWTGNGSPLVGPGASDCRVLTYSPDGKYLLCAGGDGVLSLWRPGKLAPDRYYSLGLGPLISLGFSPVGGLLVAASAGQAKLFRFSGGELKALAEIGRSTIGGEIRSVVFVDETLVALGSSGPGILLLDVQGFSRAGMLRGHVGAVNVLMGLPGRRLASCGEDQSVRIWDATTASPIRTLKGHLRAVCSAALASDAGHMFTGDRGGTVTAWDLSRYRLSAYLSDPRLIAPSVSSAARPTAEHHHADAPPHPAPHPARSTPHYGGVTTTYGNTIREPCTAQPVPAGYICQCNCVPY